MNTVYQRIAKSDKKAFPGDECKKYRNTTEWERLEISSRKLEIPREQFHAKVDTIKDRNCMD